MRLFLLRHPPPIVAAGICYGSSDLAVAAEQRARVMAERLPSLPPDLRLYSSPLRRCAELAVDMATALGVPIHYDARLAEMHFGAWEMCAWDAIARAEIDAWAEDPAGYRPGGGESVLQMAQRVRAFHEELLQSQQDALLICHAGTIKMLQACRPGFSLREMALDATQTRQKIGYGELLVIAY
jgi:alpha-ribazole phosphatase